MALRASRALMMAMPAIRGSLSASSVAISTASPSWTAAAPVLGAAAARELLPRGFATLAGDVSEGILASKSTTELTEFLERNLGSITPQNATTALVRYGLVGGAFPGERDLQNRIGAVLPTLIKQIPSMDAEGKKMAETVVSQFKAAGWKL